MKAKLGGADDAQHLAVHAPRPIEHQNQVEWRFFKAEVHQLLWLALSVLGVTVGRALCDLLASLSTEFLGKRVERDAREELYISLLGKSQTFHNRQRVGDIMARATNDLNAVRMMLGPGVMYWTETSLTFALAIAIMIRFEWRLAIFSLLPAPAVSLSVIYFGRRIHARFERIDPVAERLRYPQRDDQVRSDGRTPAGLLLRLHALCHSIRHATSYRTCHFSPASLLQVAVGLEPVGEDLGDKRRQRPDGCSDRVPTLLPPSFRRVCME